MKIVVKETEKEDMWIRFVTDDKLKVTYSRLKKVEKERVRCMAETLLQYIELIDNKKE